VRLTADGEMVENRVNFSHLPGGTSDGCPKVLLRIARHSIMHQIGQFQRSPAGGCNNISCCHRNIYYLNRPYCIIHSGGGNCSDPIVYLPCSPKGKHSSCSADQCIPNRYRHRILFDSQLRPRHDKRLVYWKRRRITIRPFAFPS